MELLFGGLGLLLFCLLLAAPIAIIFTIISYVKIKNLTQRVALLEQKIDRSHNLESLPGSVSTPDPAVKIVADTSLATPPPDLTPEKTICEPVEKIDPVSPAKPQPMLTKPATGKSQPIPPLPSTASSSSTSETEKKSGSNTAESPLASALLDLKKQTRQKFSAIGNWLLAGEEYRNSGVSREYAVATTWLIRLGVLTLLCGIGFFMKYSVDRNWTPPLYRVLGMSAAGIAAVSFGFWQQRGKYRQLAIAAIGGGFTVLYLSVLAAYKLYALLPSTTAFILMIVITAAAMLSAVYTKALSAAMIGCIAGFLTPDFIYSGNISGNTLMIYLSIISAGVLLITFFRDWILLNVTALFLYAIFSTNIQSGNALLCNILCMLNYVIYTLQITLTARKRDITIIGMIFLAFNWALGYFNGAVNWSSAPVKFIPELFIALPAILSVSLIYIFKSRKLLADRPFFAGVFYLQSALSLTLLMPELLKNAPACTLIAAWSISALALNLWGLFERSRTLIFCSQLLLGVIFICEILSPAAFNVQFDTYLQAIATRLTVFGSFILALTIIGASMYHYSKRNTESPFLTLTAAGIFNLAQAFLIFAVYSGAEMFYLLKHLDYFNDYLVCFISSYWSILTAVSVWCCRKIDRPKCLIASMLLFLINTVFLLATEESSAIEPYYFKSLLYTLFTGAVYTGTLFFIGWQLRNFKQPETGSGKDFRVLYRKVYLLAGVLALVISSSELFELLDVYLPNFRDGGLSFYWSILAFGLIFLGIKKRIKALRISGIALFILTVIKVFLQDLSGLEQLWRIVAFVIIGVVLLVGAIIYIKRKDMFVENIAPRPEDKQ